MAHDPRRAADGLDPVEYLAVIVAVATTLGAAVAIGLLAGCARFGRRPPMIVTLARLRRRRGPDGRRRRSPRRRLPGGALLLLARVAGIGPGHRPMRCAPRASAWSLTAVVLVACRLALERADL